MIVIEEALLRSGFSRSDLQIIKNNVGSYGGTLEEAIQDLARRFRAVIWIVSTCLIVFISAVLFASTDTVMSVGVGIAFAIVITIFVQPPVLAYKSWRYWRSNKN